LGLVSQDLADLFRPLGSSLANKDPVELKPPYRVRRATHEALSVDHYPIGIICIKIRMPGEEIAVNAIVNSDYMKWAIVESLAAVMTRIGSIWVRPEAVLACSDEIEILDVQTPYMGDSLWQICEFRFDYKIKVDSLEDADKAISNMLDTMVEFEADFCQTLEFAFREIYHMTVLNLVNKRFILMDGQDISDQVALFKAAQSNDLNKIRSLLQRRVQVDAFQKAVRFPSALLDEDARFLLVTLGRTALLGAVEQGHIEAMRLLLDAKADVNFQDNSGFHALYLAAGAPKNAEKAVNMLLAWGADICLANSSGYTPLHNGCGCGELGGIRSLLEERADLNLRSSSGAAPVHVAVINDQPAVLELLKEFGANLDMPAFGGNTPVHEGVMQNNPDIIAKLFELKADINIESGPDHGFATPLAMATQRKKKKAMRKLIELKAIEKVEHEYEDSSEGEFALSGDGEYVPRVRGRLL